MRGYLRASDGGRRQTPPEKEPRRRRSTEIGGSLGSVLAESLSSLASPLPRLRLRLPRHDSLSLTHTHTHTMKFCWRLLESVRFLWRWTFALVMVHFAIATVFSIRGCKFHARKAIQNGEKDSDDCVANEKFGFLENLLQIIYQTSAGASMFTDIVFWCFLLTFMTGKNFKLTLLIGYMHFGNAVFLIITSALSRMPFTWFGIIYFILWSCSYVVFQWIVRACCVKW